MLLSQILQIDKKLDEAGVFDPVLEKDSNFFINIQRLKQTDIPEFVNSYNTIQSFFRSIIKLLDKAQLQSRSDTFYNAAVKMFHFPEVNGIRLGHSKSGRGAGFGPIIEEQVIYTAFDIVKAGIEDPEFFEMIPLFQKNVGSELQAPCKTCTSFYVEVFKRLAVCERYCCQIDVCIVSFT